jgi:Ferritin-like domain
VTRPEPADGESVAPPPMLGRSRRSLLGAGLTGAVVAIATGRVAGAAAPPSTGPGLSESDVELLSFAQGVELAAAQLYEAAFAAGAESDVLSTIAYNHRAYGQAVAGLTGVSANSPNEEVYNSLQSDFATGDTTAVALAGYELESVLVATHTELLALLTDVNAAKLIASIIAVEARQCTVTASLGGNGDDIEALLVNTAEPVLPASSS